MTRHRVGLTISDAVAQDVLHALAQFGIDDFVVADYCRIAGVSRPTFYSRFGSVEGLLADVWVQFGPDWLNRLVSSDFTATTRDVGMSLILAVSHRKNEIGEVVEPSVEKWWHTQSSGSLPEAVAWLAANRLGVLLSLNAVPQVLATLSVDQSISASTAVDIDRTEIDDSTFIELPAPVFSNQFLDAAFTVVGKVGYRSASMTRIARTAMSTTGTLYPQFENAPSLLAKVYSEAQAQIVEGNYLLWSSREFSIPSFGSYVSGGLSPHRERWRKLRLETFIAARDPQSTITAMAAASIGKMGDSLLDTIIRAGVSGDLLVPLTYFFHTLGLGLTVLDHASVPVTTMAHTEMTRIVARQLFAGAAVSV